MNIFVARLDFKLKDETLNNLFQQYGEVSSAKIIIDRDTGRSKGFGFVEMPNEDEAQQAISNLNGTIVEGREIVVKKANPRPQRNDYDRSGYRSDD